MSFGQNNNLAGLKTEVGISQQFQLNVPQRNLTLLVLQHPTGLPMTT
jgi:hypothetical protein